jgi:hypothetical protein
MTVRMTVHVLGEITNLNVVFVHRVSWEIGKRLVHQTEVTKMKKRIQNKSMEKAEVSV